MLVVTTLQHQEPVDTAIYNLHLQKAVLTEPKIYRKTHEAKMHHFLLKCIIQTRNISEWMCTAYMREAAFLCFINLKFKFCFWGFAPAPPGLRPWTPLSPSSPKIWTTQPQKPSYTPVFKIAFA